MIRFLSSIVVFAGLLALGLPADPAQAQLARTFVSAASGNDANNCDRPTPCRTFQGAHDKTFDQGEVIVLDPGGYGSLTITKSISIVNDMAGAASIAVSGGATGITVNAPPGGGYVNLRGITVQGIGFGGGSGLVFNTGFSLTLSNCLIRNHTGNGILFAPSTGGAYNLAILNTVVADNGLFGIAIAPTSSAFLTLRAMLDRVTATSNSHDGLDVDGSLTTGPIKVTVTNSTMSNNLASGIVFATALGHATVNGMVTHSVVANNGLDGLGLANASLWFGDSAITHNQKTVGLEGSFFIRSFGDNYIAGNGDGNPALPTIPTK